MLELRPDTWILHHNIASAHNILPFQVFFAKRSLKFNSHMSDLALCHFWLFPMLKISWKDHSLSDIVNIQGHMMTIMNSTPEEGYQHCFKLWEHWLIVCVTICQDYF